MAGSTVKMGVDVTQFKQGMRDAQTSVKTLDQELKRSEAQYKATGDKEKYMTEQTKLLKQKLEEQKTAAKNAEKALDAMRKNGVAQTSTEYQKMAQQLAAAQTGMYNTEAALNSLNTAQVTAAKSASDLSNNVAGIGQKMSLQQVQSGLKSITGALETAAGYALQIGKNIVSSVTDMTSWADNLLTNSIIYGIDQDTLQKWELVATQFEVTVESMVTARQKLATNMKYGSQDVQDAFDELNISPYKAITAGGKTAEAKRELKDVKDFIWEVGEALAKMDRDDPNTNALAQKILGKNWAELMPLFTRGREEYESFMKTVSTVDEETVQSAADANNAIEKLQYEWQVTTRTLSGSLAPALTDISNILQGVLKEFNDYLSSDEGKEKLKELSDAVTSLFEGLKDIKPGDVIDTARSILTGIVDAVKWIAENWEKVTTGIHAIVDAWIGLEVAKGITTLLNLINGISTLSAGTAAANGAAVGSAWGGNFATSASAAILKAVPWLAAAIALVYPVAEKVKEAGGVEAMAESAKEGIENFPTNVAAAFGDKNAKAKQLNNFIEKEKNDPIFQDLMKRASESGEKYPEDKNTLYRDQIKKLREYEKILDQYLIEKPEDMTLQRWYAQAKWLVETKGYGMPENPMSYDELKYLKEMQENGLEIPAELTPEDQSSWAEWAKTIVNQTGVVQIPAELRVVGIQTTEGGSYRPGGGGGGTVMTWEPGIRSFANALPFVPWDGYPAILHKGERIMSARENKQYTYNSNTYFGSVNLNNGMEIDALSESIARQNRRHNAGYGA